MDMSLDDTLAALGLDDEVTVSPRTGRNGGGNFFTIPSRWSRSHREDSTLTPGQTPLAPGTSGNYTVRRAGGPIRAPGRGPGTTHGCCRTLSLWAEGSTVTSRDNWCQCSTPRDSPL